MNKRKDEHLKYALEIINERDAFAEMRLIHRSISTVNYDEVDLSTTLRGKQFAFPIYINAMTGGTKKAYEINKALCEIASKTGIMLCFGSISPVLKDNNLLVEYRNLLAEYDDLVFSLNIGMDKNYAMVSEIIEDLNPDFLQLHLNTLQELIMPEGDRDFSDVVINIKSFVQQSKVDIIVKEVGFGMSKETVAKLKELGVKLIDISGSGGTNFAKIENLRRDKALNYLNDFGLSTLESLLENQEHIEELEILASGGVKNALDVVKCLVLGAKSVGMSRGILAKLEEIGIDGAIEYIEDMKSEIRLIMTLLGAKDINQLKAVDYVLEGRLYQFYQQRR